MKLQGMFFLTLLSRNFDVLESLVCKG